MSPRQLMVSVLSRCRKAGYPCSATQGWLGIAAAHGAIFKSKNKARQFLLDRYMTADPAAVMALKPDQRPGPCKITKAKMAEAKRSVSCPGYPGDVNAPEFLGSFQWRALRLKVLQHYGRRCLCCGASPDNGKVMHVDHIKPRRLFPHLALDFDNLQVLCEDCNHGKGNHDHTDFRPAVGEFTEERISAMLRDIARGG